MTIVQKTIMQLLERGEDFVTVHGCYIGDVLALQVQGLVLVGPMREGKVEVRPVVKATVDTLP